MSNGKFENYKVLACGSTSGIGLAVTKMFLAEGAVVLGLGRNFSNTAELGNRYIPFRCDATDVDQLQAAANEVGERFGGHLDVLFNSAGVGVHHSLSNVTEERFDYAVDLLLRPSVMLTKFCREYLYAAEHGDPVILHVSSVGARTIVPDNILYGMCKTSLNLYCKQSAAGLPGIRVFTLSPGTFKTPIFGRDPKSPRSPEQIQAMYDSIAKSIPSQRVAETSEIADLVSFLCSGEASYMTGCDCTIDGGLLSAFG